jgi:hypothetical protein
MRPFNRVRAVLCERARGMSITFFSQDFFDSKLKIKFRFFLVAAERGF